jgi:hypothetical protein
VPGLRAGKVVVIGTDDGIAGIGDAAARTRRGRHHTDPVRTQFVSTGASIGVVLLLLTLAGWLLGLSGVGILALAGVTYISSSGVIARLLSDLRRLGNRETPAVLSILVQEDSRWRRTCRCWPCWPQAHRRKTGACPLRFAPRCAATP